MFEIRNVYCDDKKLGDVLRALAGLVAQPPLPVALVNASIGKNGVGAASTASDIVELFSNWLGTKKLETFRSRDVKTFLRENGRSPASYSNLINKAKERKIMVSVKGKRGQFKVL